MDELEGRSLVRDFNDQWSRIDAYEKRRDLIPHHVQRVVDVAMAINDEVWQVEGPDEARLETLYEELGVAAVDYREKEGDR